MKSVISTPISESFQSIFDEFSSMLRRYISYRIRDNSAVDDILQEVFLRLYKNQEKIAKKEKIKSWLFSVAKNSIVDYYRKQSQNEVLDVETGDVAYADEEDFYDEFSGCVNHFLAQLSSTYSEALRLYELEEFSLQEIADMLNMPLSSVKSKVQRGRKKLKDAIFACCEYEFDVKGKPVTFKPKCCKSPKCLKN